MISRTWMLEVYGWKRCPTDFLREIGDSTHKVLLDSLEYLLVNGRTIKIVERTSFASKSKISSVSECASP